MLQFENVSVHEFAFDRITPKMIKFLSKHYLMNNYLTQNNGYVVYLTYFEAKKSKRKQLSEFAEKNLCKFFKLFFLKDNPNKNIPYLHSHDNREMQKGLRNSPFQLGGADYKSHNKNIFMEYHPSKKYLESNFYNMSNNANPYPNINNEVNYLTKSKKSSEFIPSLYSNHVGDYNYNMSPHNQNLNEYNKFPNKSTINKVFGSIFLNDFSSSSSRIGNESVDDEFFSKKKKLLLRDYNAIQRRDENEFKKQELQKRAIEQGMTNQRIEDIQRSISPTHSKFYEYNKKYDHKTLFDDKKILLNKAVYGNYFPDTSETKYYNENNINNTYKYY